MAEGAIRQLEEQLNCSICLDIYDDPKILQCFHTYCRKCLVKLVVRDQQGDLSLTCPICRQAMPVPANGVRSLQSAFQINEYLQIRDDLIKKTASLEGSNVDAMPLTLSTEKTIPNCFEHVDKERELYCETCEELICLKCALKGGKHHNHDYDEIDNAYERYKGEVRPSLEPMEGKLDAVKKALVQVDTRCGEVSNQREVIEDSIQYAIREPHQLLDVRKTKLIRDFKLKGLASQKKEMETIQAQLSSCLDFVKRSLETENKGDVLMMKKNIVNQVKELTTPFQPDILKPNTEADMRFFSSPDPIKTIDRVDGPWGVAVNQRGEVVVTECDGHCVSVFSQCGKKLRSFGTFGSDHGQFNYPHGVAVDSEGNILVTDTDNQRIQKFTTTGEFLTAVGTKGSGPLQFKNPYDITFNATNSKVYVVDHLNHRVQVLNSDLTFSSTFGKGGSSKGQFKYPRSIACDSNGNVYVTDSINNRIQVFTSGGEFLRMFGRYGEGRGELNCPVGITVDTNDIVYVSEFHNDCVSVFTCEGQFFTSFGRKGIGLGEFNGPVGLAVDNCGVVYVCDCSNNYIQCFLYADNEHVS